MISSLLFNCFTCHALYSFIFLDFKSNDAILGVIGEEPDALAKETKEETPQQIAEWTADDVF